VKALQLTAYGDPNDVIKLTDLPDFGPLAADEWIIDMEVAPVSPTDRYIIAGIYGELPPLPHGLGCEGIGRVSAVGSGVKHVKVGDRVIAPLLQNTTWSTRIKTNETWQRALPEGNPSQMAQVGMNPARRGGGPLPSCYRRQRSAHGLWRRNLAQALAAAPRKCRVPRQRGRLRLCR
jgi:NADPH:quinone reductase-like Zn-dependent oxidoreductase